MVKKPILSLISYLEGIFEQFKQKIDISFKNLLNELTESSKLETLLMNLQDSVQKKITNFESREKKFEEEKTKLQTIHQLTDDILELNVGGRLFTTFKPTLTKIPNSLLSSMFSGYHPISRDNKGRFFIDRDPELFNIILNQLRSENFFAGDQIIYEEMKYYGLDSCLKQGERIFVFGGSDGVHPLSSVEYFDLYEEKWVPSVSMLSPRYQQAIIIGGADAERLPSDSMEAFDPVKNKWEKMPSMNSARNGCAAVLLDDLIYSIGGQDIRFNVLKTIETFDFSLNAWNYTTPLPYHRWGMAAVPYNGQIYVLGGHDNQGHRLSSVDCFNPTTHIWTNVASMPTCRTGLAALLCNSKIYAIGGWDEYALSTFECYDPENNTWQRLPGVPHHRKCCGAVFVDQKIYICGGHDGKNRLNFVDCFDFKKNSWASYINMISNRSAPAAAYVRLPLLI